MDAELPAGLQQEPHEMPPGHHPRLVAGVVAAVIVLLLATPLAALVSAQKRAQLMRAPGTAGTLRNPSVVDGKGTAVLVTSAGDRVVELPADVARALPPTSETEYWRFTGLTGTRDEIVVRQGLTAWQALAVAKRNGGIGLLVFISFPLSLILFFVIVRPQYRRATLLRYGQVAVGQVTGLRDVRPTKGFPWLQVGYVAPIDSGATIGGGDEFKGAQIRQLGRRPELGDIAYVVYDEETRKVALWGVAARAA